MEQLNVIFKPGEYVVTPFGRGQIIGFENFDERGDQTQFLLESIAPHTSRVLVQLFKKVFGHTRFYFTRMEIKDFSIMKDIYVAKVDHYTFEIDKRTGQVISVNARGRRTEIDNQTLKNKAYGKMIIDLRLRYVEFNKHYYAFLFGSAFNILTGKTVTNPDILKLFKD